MTLSPQERAAAADPLLRDPQRLAAVRDTQLLDTPPDELFDEMSRLASQVLGVSASFVAIVDADRDFYKSQVGFPEPLASQRQLGGRTFCHFTLASSEPLVIADTHADPVWQGVPTVASLGVRAYLGVPLIVGGQPIGSFCAIDSQPRDWSPLQVGIMVQLARSMERELKLAASLRVALLKAERANALARANERLMAVVAHDLRTPLQTISLTASMLVRAADAQLAPHALRLKQAASAMESMVDHLLAVYTTGSVIADVAALFPAAQLLADARSTMELVAQNAGLMVQLGPLAQATVRVDYAQMLRVLCNLIGNCVKYCPAGSTAVLAAEVVGGEVVISISDDGPGMSADQQSRAFERGWQACPDAARREGAGLGLAIVQELVEVNGGRVALGGVPGDVGGGAAGSADSGGVCVTIWLPVAA